MTIADVEREVVKIAAQVFKRDKSEITPDSQIMEDLGADSLDQVEFMMAVEAAFDCQISDEDAGQIVTIADAIKYIDEKKKKMPAN
jgi:acyl carrier protein